MANPISPQAIKQAVDIAIAAVTGQNGHNIGNGDAVAEFVEVVAKKINDLQNGTY